MPGNLFEIGTQVQICERCAIPVYAEDVEAHLGFFAAKPLVAANPEVVAFGVNLDGFARANLLAAFILRDNLEGQVASAGFDVEAADFEVELAVAIGFAFAGGEGFAVIAVVAVTARHPIQVEVADLIAGQRKVAVGVVEIPLDRQVAGGGVEVIARGDFGVDGAAAFDFGRVQVECEFDFGFAIFGHLERCAVTHIFAVEVVIAGGGIFGEGEGAVYGAIGRKGGIEALQILAAIIGERHGQAFKSAGLIAAVVGFAHDGAEVNRLPRSVDWAVGVKVDFGVRRALVDG